MTINQKEITEQLKNPAKQSVSEIIEKALFLKGLSLSETAKLLLSEEEKEIGKIFSTAKTIKDKIYGNRLVIFAPLYTSNECGNNCLYCAFRKENLAIKRRSLSLDEIRLEVEALEDEGHKRLLLVAGEDPSEAGIERIEQIIKVIYSTRKGKGEIRRINVNVAPLSIEDFRRLKMTGIGTYQLFQETYHRESYAAIHPSGPKANYDYRLSAMERALQAGVGDVGIGALFGLYDYRFEVLALLSHARHLEDNFKIGPHTISVPRLEPALGAPLAQNPPSPVSDFDFKKIVAILRLAVPYTGIILSTRESAEMRNELFNLGVSQLSAGSRTNPGGYSDIKGNAGQFSLQDHRSTAQVISDILKRGYVPSFCTACYRRGRTGEEFMELAKPGEIQHFCLPNSLLTLKEYLVDYASEEMKVLGNNVIDEKLREIEKSEMGKATAQKLSAIEQGKRDLFF